MTQRPILPPDTLMADTQKFLNVLNDEPDFSVVVLSAGYLDACLGSLLHAAMRKSEATKHLLNPKSGALGSFAARNEAAYCLGLINKSVSRDLKQITEIRNMVAHDYLSSQFSDTPLKEACLKLNHLRTMKNGDLEELVYPPERQMPPAKERFKFTVVVIATSLLTKAKNTAHVPAEA